MSNHTISTQYWNRTDNTIVTCTCGWTDRWEGNDGSAEQSGAAHQARAQKQENQRP